jgi:hypothetical protein
MVKYALVIMMLLLAASAWGVNSMKFDVTQWATGMMDADPTLQGDSNGTKTANYLDYYYYYARAPMRLDCLDDSLSAGSSDRTYDSAVLMLVADHFADSLNAYTMRIFAKRLTSSFTENGVSWLRRSTANAWTTPGGDVGSGCSDTIVVDSSYDRFDSLYFHIDTGFIRYLVEIDNIGWLMMAENIVPRFPYSVCSEDNATAAYRPKLTVYYTNNPPGGATTKKVGKGKLGKSKW